MELPTAAAVILSPKGYRKDQVKTLNGYLSSYGEFLFIIQIAVKLREFAIVPKRSSSSAKINIDDFCGNIYIDNVDVSKHQCRDKVISNVVCYVFFPAARFFGLLYLVGLSGIMKNKFCISNKRVYDRNMSILYSFYFQNDCVET